MNNPVSEALQRSGVAGSDRSRAELEADRAADRALARMEGSTASGESLSRVPDESVQLTEAEISRRLAENLTDVDELRDDWDAALELGSDGDRAGTQCEAREAWDAIKERPEALLELLMPDHRRFIDLLRLYASHIEDVLEDHTMFTSHLQGVRRIHIDIRDEEASGGCPENLEEGQEWVARTLSVRPNDWQRLQMLMGVGSVVRKVEEERPVRVNWSRDTTLRDTCGRIISASTRRARCFSREVTGSEVAVSGDDNRIRIGGSIAVDASESLAERFSDELGRTHRDARSSFEDGLTKLECEERVPRTWSGALERMREVGDSNPGGRVLLRPMVNDCPFSDAAISKVVDNVLPVAQRLRRARTNLSNLDDLINNPNTRREYVVHRKNAVHQEQGGFLNTLECLRMMSTGVGDDGLINGDIQSDLESSIVNREDQSANEELRQSVREARQGEYSGVVAFLINLAQRGRCGEVSRGDFQNAEHQHGFGYRGNKQYIKGNLRRARRGHHEWIPVSRVTEIIDLAEVYAQVQRAVQWLVAMHEARTPTSFIIFQESADSTFGALNEALDSGDQDQIDAAVAEFRRVGLALHGHIGALYVEVTDGDMIRRVQQTDGQNRWHRQLVEMFHNSNDPLQWLGRLEAFIENSVWNGLVPEVIGDDPSRYTDSRGNQMSTTIRNIGRVQRQRLSDILDRMIPAVFRKLEEMSR